MKLEWRKQEKHLYLPKPQPTLIDVPKQKFIVIEGEVNPNSDAFVDYVKVLYSLSYGIRMSYKWKNPPSNYQAYTVYPLEGLWDLKDKTKSAYAEDNLKFSLMIRQPDFVDEALFNKTFEMVTEKKPHPLLTQVKFTSIDDGKCVQMLHIGSYKDEPASFNEMDQYLKANNLKRKSMIHREIYLNDPKKVDANKLKTVLRIQVE